MPFKFNPLLAPEGEAPAGGSAAAGLGPSVDPAPAAPAGAPATQSPQGERIVTRTGKVLPMSDVSIDRLKKEQQEKGRRAYESDMAKRAKELGYDSVDDMFRALDRKNGGGKNRAPQNGQRQQTRQSAQPQTAPAGEQPNSRRSERRDREHQVRLDKERRQRISLQRKLEDAEQARWAAEANGQLQVQAIRVGIKDPDYAIELLTREMNQQRMRMTDGEYSKYEQEFSEEKFFEGLKSSRPYLFQEAVVPATTGTTAGGSGSAPPPPGAGKVNEAAARAGQVNAAARTANGKPVMSNDEYRAELQRRGLRQPVPGA